jgi:ribosome-binding protein aMBF1 (putative translation factor)
MQDKKITDRISAPGPVSDDERQRLEAIRAGAKKDFPPSTDPRLRPAIGGIGAQIKAAREAQGLTWYSLAEKAGISSASVVRDMEYGREVTLANIESVVAALGLKLELVASPSA